MEVVNPFILKNKERMIVFLDQLSSVTDPNPPPGSYVEANSNHLCADTGKFDSTVLITVYDEQFAKVLVNRELELFRVLKNRFRAN